jgi:hypothetical protein
MNKKKLLIGGIALLVIIAIALTIYNKLSSPPASSTDSSPNQQPTISLFPTDVHTVQNINDTAEIQSSFNSYRGETIPNEALETRVRDIKIADTEGQNAAIVDVISTLNATLPASITEIVDKRDYNLFYCPDYELKKHYGLLMNIKFGNNPMTDEAIVARLKQWEPTMLKDLAPVLFPDISFSTAQLTQPIQFKDGKYRYAEFALPDGSSGSINYVHYGSPIVISSSTECMTHATKHFFDPGEGYFE